MQRPVTESAPVLHRVKKRRVPVVTEDGRTQPVASIRLPVELWERIAAEADRQGTSRNGLIRQWAETLPGGN